MFLLVDGSNLVHRALHISYKKNGTYSYLDTIPEALGILTSYINYYMDHCSIILAWDKGLPLFRRELYSEYKPDSVPVGDIDVKFLSEVNLDPEASYRSQHSDKDLRGEYTKAVSLLSRVIIPSCNCLSLRVTNCEADDIIAWFCYHFPEVSKTIISSDRDLLQLVNENTSMYSFATSFEYTWEWALENYSNPEVFRKQYILEKAILGDTSDNIPSVQGVGDKTVKKYSDQIMYMLSKGNTLKAALIKLQRPPRAGKDAYEALKRSFSLISTNMNLMDLYYPIETNQDFVKEIKSQIVMMRNFNPDYFSCMEKIEAIEGLHFTCANLASRIFQANQSINRHTGFLDAIK